MQKKVKNKTTDEMQVVSDDVNERIKGKSMLLENDNYAFETPAEVLHHVQKESKRKVVETVK